jgi:hypothetical protein
VLVECKNCGAPLDVNGVERFVRCSYCDKVNRVRTMHTMAAVTPAEWQPPPTWQPPPQFGPRRSQPLPFHAVSSPLANRLPLIIIGFVLLTSVGGFVPFAVAMLGGARTTGSDSPEPSRTLALHIDRLVRSSPLGVQARTGQLASVVTGSSACPGYIPAEPQLTVRTHRLGNVAILPSSADTVLVLRRASGDYLCSTAGHPAIAGELARGAHQLWVGSLRAGVTSSVTLDFRTTLPSDRLRPYASPRLGTLSDRRVDLAAITRRSGTVEGAVDVSELGVGCRGAVSPGPQLTVELMEARRMAFAFEQHTDELVLMVRTPRGQVRCESVAPGGPSALSFDLPAGRSAVWVGVADLAARGEYTVATRAAE